MKCQQCGAEVAQTDTFCGSCGSPVAAAGGAAPPPPPPPPPGQFTAPPGQYPRPPAAPPPVGAYGSAGFADPATGVPLAEWWQRAVAAIIDGFVIGIPWIIVYFILHSIATTTTNNGFYTTTSTSFAVVLLAYLIFAVAWFGYYVFFNGGEKGQTLGKMAMGIATRDESGRAPLGYQRAALRWLVILGLDILCVIPLIIDYLSPLWDPRRQAWHDKAAHSVVVTTK